MSFELFIRTGEATAERVPLDRESITLGRAHSNRLCFPEDASLSRQHLTFEPEGGSWTVRDLGSKNGTLINGTRIEQPHTLRPGDRISAGRLTILFNEAGAGTTAERVEFYGGPGIEPAPQATVMTSLEGLLSGEISRPMVAVKPGAAPVKEEPRADTGGFQEPMIRALIRAGRELAGHRPLEELFQLILDLSIEAVGAERGLLMTLEGEELRTRASHGDGFRMSTAVRDRVLRDKSSMLVRDAQADQAFRERLSISEQQIRTMMAVPLQTDDRVIGMVYVDSRFFVREFTPDDLNLLTVLANVAAIRIEHERLILIERDEQNMKAELQQAAKIQERILPAKAPAVDGYDVAGHNQPCRTVGGDYYDFVRYPDDRLALILGDVAGKGISAALMVSGLHARINILTESSEDLADLVGRLDRSIAVDCPSNRFITLFVGLLDPGTGELVYCNAGHNPPLVLRAAGGVDTLGVTGTVLGILPEMGYEEQRAKLEPGDTLVVFSDGVTEAANPEDEEFGEDRLVELIRANGERSSDELIDIVNDAVETWTCGAPPADDMTLVIARRC